MKIIIVGAGVSGLALYLQLRKVLPNTESHIIHVYESQNPRETVALGRSDSSLPSNQDDLTDSTAVVGNTIALAPNSVRLLNYIDNRLYTIFKTRGYTNHSYTFKTARGHTIAMTPTGDNGSDEEYSVSCPRYGLWKCFHDIVGEDRIHYGKVIDVLLDGKKPLVKFADGREEDADLVVGADGVRSVVKRAIFGDENEHEYAPHYEGFCGVGSCIDMDIPKAITKDQSMVFTFGPTGSFGYCSAAPLEQRKLGWRSNWGNSTIPDRNVIDPEQIRRQLHERHGSWQDPVIRTIVEKMSTDCVYPIWTTPELPHWGGEKGTVLLGDAAHTLQATSGQGAGQALEDSVTFSLLLSHYVKKIMNIASNNSNDGDDPSTIEEAIQLAAKALYEIRNPRVSVIRSRARNLYLTDRPIRNVVVEYLYYAFIYMWTNFPNLGQLIVGNVFKEIEGWNAEEQVKQYLCRKGH